MKRTVVTRKRTGTPAPARVAVDPETPKTGFFRVHMRRGAPPSGIMVWYGPPIDEDGQEMEDRPWAWQARRNDALIDIWSVWPGCAVDEIDFHEYQRISEAHKTMDEDSAFFDGRKPVDLYRVPPPF